MVEIPIKPEWVGKNLIELNLRKKYSMNVVAIISEDTVTTSIDPTSPLQDNVKLIVIADTSKLKKI